MRNDASSIDIAQFRLAVIGDLLVQDFARGDLKRELQLRAARWYRPPPTQQRRQYHWKTLQRWYYEAKTNLENLQPTSRRRGTALALDEDQRQHLLQLRRENPSAAADLLLRAAEDASVLGKGQVSVSTVRRLFREEDLSRQALRRGQRRERRRWEAARVGDVWHADVCHVWVSTGEKKSLKHHVHGLLDDKSRYVLALQTRQREEEVDFLCLFASALLRHPKPQLLYVDNGACYSGKALQAVCQRLGIILLHARPYDPESRGKMERFWQTMRYRCTDHLGARATFPEVQAALSAWLEMDYHSSLHSSLCKASPNSRYLQGIQSLPGPLSVRELAQAFELKQRRKVRKDNTLTLHGRTYEVAGRLYAGKTVDVVVDALTKDVLRATWKDKAVPIGLCDPVANAKRGRPAPTDPPPPAQTFDPIAGYIRAFRKENPYES